MKDVQALIDDDSEKYPAIRRLAKLVLDNYEQYKIAERDQNQEDPMLVVE